MENVLRKFNGKWSKAVNYEKCKGKTLRKFWIIKIFVNNGLKYWWEKYRNMKKMTKKTSKNVGKYVILLRKNDQKTSKPSKSEHREPSHYHHWIDQCTRKHSIKFYFFLVWARKLKLQVGTVKTSCIHFQIN